MTYPPNLTTIVRNRVNKCEHRIKSGNGSTPEIRTRNFLLAQVTGN